MRRFAPVQRILGLLLMLFSISMLPPALVGLYYGDGAVAAFLIGFAITAGAGLVIWLPVMRNRAELRLRDGFLVVVLFWTVLGLFGAVPFLMSERPDMSVHDAVFESVSGLTTTGSTVLSGIENLPHAIRWYRQQLQWLGGMGIIVLAVAILPMLGIGGMQLYRAETPGPMKDTKLTPRITETAKALWYLYLGLTIACALGYWAAGMEAFDAIGHAFSTVAIGGFSTYDASMGHFFDRPMIEVVAIIFMLLSGMNFALHFLAWRSRSVRPYTGDAEWRTYLLVLGVSATVTVLYLWWAGVFADPTTAALHGVFQAVSIGTTTGFTTEAFYIWPGFLPVMLIFTSFIGGCALSTGGGMKVIRFLLLVKQGARELKRIIHPNAVIPIKIGNKALPYRVVDAVWGFFSVYIAVFVVLMLILLFMGLDQVTAFSAVAATLNNLGPGLGEVGAHFADIPDAAKWFLSLAMVLGRLEIFTLLVLFTATYWRK
ncbi:potassium transporter [Ectothiorhodospiraceae bacterium 2226]|nr:potassium transporter [Ectothiorhodospiraceae bacterium 2226]